MSILKTVHEGHDATLTDRGGRETVLHYGRPERTHAAVRNGAGVIEMAYDLLVVTGDDRLDYVDNAVSNRVPATDGEGVYALLLTPQGRIRTEMYVYDAGERLLVFLPPGTGPEIAEEWQEKTFIQDVEIAEATDSFGIFGVHGPKATETIASVLTEGTPDEQLTFVRGTMGDAGVTVIRTDGLTGEEGYEVVCEADVARDVFDTLENRGLNAVPFGYQTWESLTLEAGTPLFESELDGAVPNNLGLRNAVDFEKGCFVGQEVVSRVENRGQATKRLVGLALETVPDAGATVFDGDETAGEITRAVESPTRGQPLALALLDRETAIQVPNLTVTVRVDGEEVPAAGETLPFVEGSDTSARLPAYLEAAE